MPPLVRMTGFFYGFDGSCNSGSSDCPGKIPTGGPRQNHAKGIACKGFRCYLRRIKKSLTTCVLFRATLSCDADTSARSHPHRHAFGGMLMSSHPETLPFDRIVSWPETVGDGGIRILNFTSGLQLRIHHSRFHKAFVPHRQMRHNHLEFCFCIAGGCDGKIGFRSPDFSIGPAECGLFYCEDQESHIEFSGSTWHHYVTLRVEPALFLRMIAGPGSDASAWSRKFPELRERRLRWTGPMPARAARPLEEILSCPLAGGFGRMFLEGKALELLALQSERLMAPEPHSLPADLMIKIQTARELLTADLEHPPCLTDLCKAVGLNKNHLNQGFYDLYGKSVFAFYRQYRLEKAREMLDAGEVNITEAAYRCGYAHPASFTRAFKTAFGKPPKAFLSPSAA